MRMFVGVWNVGTFRSFLIGKATFKVDDSFVSFASFACALRSMMEMIPVHLYRYTK